ELRFLRHAADVMLVRWEAGPVAGRRKDLDDQELFCREIRFDNVRDLARRVAGTANFDVDIVRLDQFGRERLRRPGRGDGELGTVLRGRLEAAAHRQVETCRLAIEHRSRPGHGPFVVTARNDGAAAQGDDTYLVV